MDVTGIILAGGKSTRMGTDKAWVEVKGKPMIDYAIDALLPVCSKVVISANRFPQYRNLEVWADDIPINAPMVGIYSCLKRAQTPLCFVLSCDMPLVDQNLVKFLISQHEEGFDITIPMHSANKHEPLCAVYSKSMVELLHNLILKQNFKLQNLTQQAKANIVNLETYYKAYNAGLFANINSMPDLENVK